MHCKRKTSLNDALILHMLMDGKIHTQKEIASKIEVNRKTIYRGIERLRMIFIIHTFRGGSTGGGIYLDSQHIYYGLKRLGHCN